MGFAVGETVGGAVGVAVGPTVGDVVGDEVGDGVVGIFVGDRDCPSLVGLEVVGETVGDFVGALVDSSITRGRGAAGNELPPMVMLTSSGMLSFADGWAFCKSCSI